jgi:hypothetical protein
LRHIVGEFLEYRPGARRPFILDEAHRPAADMLVDLLERIGCGDPRRHDETARRDDLAERQQHFRIGLFQHPPEGAVVDDRKFILDRLDHLAHGLARRPSVDARHRIVGTHRLAVVEFEPGPQPERPDEAVRGHVLGLDHLALHLEVGVHAIQHVPDQEPGVARDVGGTPDRIEVGDVRMGHETQRPSGGALRDRRGRESARRGQDAGTGYRLQECSSVHEVHIPVTASHEVGYMTGAHVSPVAP